MDYLYHGLRVDVLDQKPLRDALADALGLPDIEHVAVEREALDARKKPSVYRVLRVRFSVGQVSQRLKKLLASGRVSACTQKLIPQAERTLLLPPEPIIVGFGPAGMFCALELARLGYRPIVFDRGDPIPARAEAVARLWQNGILDPESNLQFGEGGAGTWSDGKLTTGKSSPFDREILETFVSCGAPERILIANKPHIGTDYLRRVVTTMRQRIVALGGNVHFRSPLSDIQVSDTGTLIGATIAGSRITTRCLILAIGHSARDTTAMLYRHRVAMETKPFALGTRIEHPAGLINEAQYGPRAAAVLSAADYRLTHRYDGRGVFSFCMCPGGQVVCASSEPDGQVSNGMSHYARSGQWSNAALVVGIDPKQEQISDPLAAIAFQRQLEARAYKMAGGGYAAPGQRAVDFLSGDVSPRLPETTYRPGVRPARLDELLPVDVTAALRAGLMRFDRIIPGFVAEGTLIGVESRTSSPVRMMRNADCCSQSVQGLYLLGEGSGYAGGIVTCARDAVRFVRRIVPCGENT